MVLFENKAQCCGCGVCSEVCPRHAIEMKSDEEGFLYPEIDSERCVDCGLCKDRCAFQKRGEGALSAPITCYAARHADESVRAGSQSGGAFSALSDYVLDHGGAVYGVVLNGEFAAIHARATDRSGRDAQRGSKYIQSVLHPILQALREDAKKGLPIVFTGTSCQIAAAQSYLGTVDQSNVYYVDILCHGVPSPMVWKDYLKWLEKEKNQPIRKVVFRDKEAGGWHQRVETIEFQDEKIAAKTFGNLFYDHCILRPSCYDCPYTKTERISDLTIGDCWGLDKNAPELDDNKGMSLITVNTRKGETLLEPVKDSLVCYPIELSQYMQQPLRTSAEKPSLRAKFWKDYASQDFAYIYRKYASDKARSRNKKVERLKRSIKKLFK